MIDTSRSMIYHINNLDTEQKRITNSLGTGKAIQNGSDNAMLHGNLINLDDKLRVTEDLKLQLDKAKVLNDTSDQNIKEYKNSLESIKVDLMKALNDGMDRDDKLALATNLKGIRENMISLMNTQVDGEFIFSGSETIKTTMVKDSNFDKNGQIEFEGDGFLRKVAVQPGSYRERGVTAYDVAFYPSNRAIANEPFNFVEGERIIDENGNEWKLNNEKNSLQQYDYNGKLNSPLVEIPVNFGPSKEVTIDLGIGTNADANGDYKISVNGVNYPAFTAAGNTAVDVYNDLKAKLEADGYVVCSIKSDDQFVISHPTNDVTVSFSDTDPKYKMTASNEDSTYSDEGLVKHNNYSINVPSDPGSRVFESKHNYFDDLNIIINALEGYGTKLDGTKGTKIDDNTVDKIIQNKLDITSKQFNATNIGHGQLGGRNAVFNVAIDKLQVQETNYNILIQETGGADIAKLSMESKALEFTYQALYSTIAKMNQLSLVNFIK